MSDFKKGLLIGIAIGLAASYGIVSLLSYLVGQTL
jgi:hypothetical protein